MKSFVLIVSFLCIGILLTVLYTKLTVSSPPLKENGTTPKTKNEFSLEKAPSLSLRGIIATMSGEVSWQSRVATQAAQIFQPRIIQQGESIETGEEGQSIITFADGISMTVQNSTRVDFIQTLPVNVVVSQPKGRATYQNDSKTPVSVHALHLLINQNAGTMQISVDEEGKIVNVTVASGEAKVAYEDSENVSNVLEVTKGEMLVFDDPTRTTSLE